jgi:Uma2 family endonuclease
MRVHDKPSTFPLTYDDYALLPQDRNRYEILEGELHMTPSPTLLHQYALIQLAWILMNHVNPGRLGQIFVAPLDVLLSEFNVLQPDILFLHHSKIPPASAKNLQVVPDLVVEILSPTSIEQDRIHKRRIYARHGVPHYWIVDPDGRIFEVYELAGSEYRLAGSLAGDATATSSLFPGLAIPLARLWA